MRKVCWPGLAEAYIDRNGNRATRYWVHPQVLVGGSILHQDDWEHLRHNYGATSVLNVDNQKTEEHLWVPEYKHLPFPDNGERIPRDLVMESIGYARRQLTKPGSVLHVHCALGGARSPSIAYGICRRVFDMEPGHIMSLIRCARPDYGIWRADEIGRYIVSIEDALSSGAPEI